MEKTRIKEITPSPTLILPQLSATGVSAQKVERGCGVKAIFGPIQASDLPAFLANDNTATETMRSITFSIGERAVLIPIEFYLLLRPFGISALVAFLISGIGPTGFHLANSIQRGLYVVLATFLGIISGSAVAPILLPWLPGRQFWIKGIWPGLATGIFFYIGMTTKLVPGEHIALFLWILAISSYQSMNFTGCTPFTSPSGVEYEMRRGIPFQILLVLASIILWISAPFLQ